MCTEQAGNGAKPGARAGIRGGGFPWARAGGMASPSARQENPDGSPELLFSLSASFSFSWFLKKTGIYEDIKNIHPKQLMERRNLSEITKRLLGMGWSSNPA